MKYKIIIFRISYKVILPKKIFKTAFTLVLTAITLAYCPEESGCNNNVTAAYSMAFFNSIPFAANGLQAGVPGSGSKAFENYITLKKLHLDWTNGLPGSGNYHKRKIYEYLVSIIGQEIKTEYDYVLESAGSPAGLKIMPKFISYNWLMINGKITGDSVKNMDGFDSKAVEMSWRTKKLISVNGILKNFRIGSGRRGDVITIYLENIRLEQFDNTKKDNKKQKAAD
jgi:hypothetical protein